MNGPMNLNKVLRPEMGAGIHDQRMNKHSKLAHALV